MYEYMQGIVFIAGFLCPLNLELCLSVLPIPLLYAVSTVYKGRSRAGGAVAPAIFTKRDNQQQNESTTKTKLRVIYHVCASTYM